MCIRDRRTVEQWEHCYRPVDPQLVCKPPLLSDCSAETGSVDASASEGVNAIANTKRGHFEVLMDRFLLKLGGILPRHSSIQSFIS